MDVILRNLAFEWLSNQVQLFGDVLDYEILKNGFIHEGERISFLGPQGIWKPKSFQYPLSITTIPDGYYADSFDDSGLLLYHYQGTNPNQWDNKALREMIEAKIPLIYLFRVIKGRYLVTWPVYIVNDNIAGLKFTVAVDNITQINFTDNGGMEEPNTEYIRRRYITTAVKVRLHQRAFRERVVQAYRTQCAFCRLRHDELLDAAHIIPDSEELGEPSISNGVSLCKIHHAAYDRLLIGISPDYIIKVNREVLLEIDGPMLKYGIQSLEGNKIILPVKQTDWPDKDKLAKRFEKFNRVA